MTKGRAWLGKARLGLARLGKARFIKKMKIIKAKIIRTGNSYAFTIPKAYINNGVIDPNKEYDIEIITDGVDLSPETIKDITFKQIKKNGR